jgi:hypothetical protein
MTITSKSVAGMMRLADVRDNDHHTDGLIFVF